MLLVRKWTALTARRCRGTHKLQATILAAFGWSCRSLLTEQPQKTSGPMRILGVKRRYKYLGASQALGAPHCPPSQVIVPLLNSVLVQFSLETWAMADTGAKVALPIRCAPELQDLTLWRQHAPRLRELYLIQNKTLKQVKKSMEEEHGWPEFK